MKTDIKRFFAYTVFDERGKNPEVEYRENPQGIVVKYSDHKQIVDSMHNLLTEAYKNIKEMRQAFYLISDININTQAEGCGLEDQGITDKYEALNYGWDQAMFRVSEMIPENNEVLLDSIFQYLQDTKEKS